MMDDLEMHSMYHGIKVKIPCQLLSSRNMIIPIKHISDWTLICQNQKTRIDYGANQ